MNFKINLALTSLGNNKVPIQDQITSRRERAALSPAEANRQAFGRFVDEVRRCECLYPTQRNVAWLLAMATLREGFNSIAFASLNELTALKVGGKPFMGLGANDLTDAVNGRWEVKSVAGIEKRVRRAGLKDLGMVVVEERAQIEAAMPLTVWLLVADSRQWILPADGWLYAADELVGWQMHLRACRRRHTSALPALAVDADLHDARATVEPMADQCARNAHGFDAEIETATDGRLSFSKITDALEVPPMAGRSALANPHSEFRNADLPAKRRHVPKVGTPCACASVQIRQGIGQGIRHKTGQNNPNWMDSFKREELKSKLHGDEREFRFVATAIIGAADWDDRSSGYAPNGVKWMKRWLAGGKHRSKAVAVFAEMLSADFVVATTPARAAQNLWEQFGGAALDVQRIRGTKKVGTLLLTQ